VAVGPLVISEEEGPVSPVVTAGLRIPGVVIRKFSQVAFASDTPAPRGFVVGASKQPPLSSLPTEQGFGQMRYVIEKPLMKTAAALLFATIATFAAENERTFDRTLSVSGPVNLDVVTDSGGIVVTPGSAGTVHVHGILKPSNSFSFGSSNVSEHIRKLAENPPVQQTGNGVRAGYVTDQSLLKGVSLRFEITVPPETEVRARADSGGVEIKGIKGPVDCKTDSGGIHVADIGSDVRAGADSGGIHIRGVKGMVHARADSGGIEALDIAGLIEAQTDSGGIRVSQTTAAPVKIRADSGGADVRLAPSGGYDIRANCESGRVVVPELATKGPISRNHAEGRLRGGGALVDIKVDSGNVHIE
jgi:hypothetical protein